MKTADFDFQLPDHLIAQQPASPRDSARLLHVAAHGVHDRTVRDLPELLRAGDVMVVNDTKVIPAQLSARRGNARIGITLDRPDPAGRWHALARNARRLHEGDRLSFEGDGHLEALVVRGAENGAVVLEFNRKGDEFREALEAAGALALPPYIGRPRGITRSDIDDYQTMFATREGAVAAPTAGLHFTPELLARIAARGVRTVTTTLHVGAGTFLPVRVDDVAAHRMHAERGEIGAEAARAINEAKNSGGRVLCVGTTTLRLLESAVQADGRISEFLSETDIFIHPGVPVRSANLLLTNFHLPRSTLFMLVCAFAGMERMQAAYSHAISTNYRFFSYGDATLLERA